MTEENKSIGNFPNLRFPGFEGEWEVRKLGDVSNISSGGTPNRNNPLFWNGNIPWVTTSLIDFNLIETTDEYITGEGLKNSSAKLFPKETLLIAMYGQGKTRGKIGMLNIEASTNQACGAIITDKSVLNPFFAFQNLAKRYDAIRDLSNQGGQENLSGGIIKVIEIIFPNLMEQEKLSSFFTIIDNRIQAQRKIIEKLETLIKESRKKLFYRKIKFKNNNGGDFPIWEMKEFNSVIASIPTKKFQIKSSEICKDGKYRVVDQGQYHIAGYSDNEINLFKDFPVIIFGDHTTILKYIDFEFIVGADGTKILKAKNNDYLNYLFHNLIFRNVESEGYKRHFTILSDIYMDIPCLEEQVKIANFLSSIQKKIDTERNILGKLDLQKKFLLANLFV